MQRFLRYTVECTLEDRAQGLKEYPIACDVFDRPGDFDPRTDSIVRVEAKRLRRKIAEYYARHGHDAEIVVSYRPGTYLPDLLWRAGPANAPNPSRGEEPVPDDALRNAATELRELGVQFGIGPAVEDLVSSLSGLVREATDAFVLRVRLELGQLNTNRANAPQGAVGVRRSDS